ncbi:MAG TPA: hypothetical protein VIS09_13100 [Streptomyces sp.]
MASNDASAAVNWRLFLPGSWDPASPKADPVKVARREQVRHPCPGGACREVAAGPRHDGP